MHEDEPTAIIERHDLAHAHEGFPHYTHEMLAHVQYLMHCWPKVARGLRGYQRYERIERYLIGEVQPMIDELETLTPEEFAASFVEVRGFGSIHGAICPHCGEIRKPEPAADIPGRPARRLTCHHCKRPFLARQAESPLGVAWMTFPL